MKTICGSLLTLVLFTITSCKKENVNAVYINFINETGKAIHQISIDNKLIDSIATNAQTGFIQFNTFSSDAGLPFCTFKGAYNNQAMEGLTQFPGCGTGKENLKNGKYTVVIKIGQFNATDYFELAFQ
ncbi:MAG: hypothetical protein ACOYKE_12935 [Ferruginibacter sp.]